MTVVPSSSVPFVEQSALSLARYAQIVGLDECNFWGVRYDGQPEYGCGSIWSKANRDMVAKALAQAQADIEAQLGYHLAPAWDVDEYHAYYGNGRMITGNGYLISGGSRAVATIQLAAVVDHTIDPAVIGPIATTVTDEAEIHVYYPGTAVEINPSVITLAGGNVTIQIPRCRMVAAPMVNNPPDGIDYNFPPDFQDTVDVRRVYNDSAEMGELVAPLCACDERTSDLCIYIRDARLGIVDVRNEAGACLAVCACGCEYQFARLSYYSGQPELSARAEDAIIRLAHSRIPSAPCGCGPASLAWTRDRNIPEVATRERINCPFGLSDGAWAAWQFARAAKIWKGGVI